MDNASKRVVISALIISACAAAWPVNAEQLRVYSYLSPSNISPVFEAFEAETGTVISVEYMRPDTILDRLVSEGEDPGADVVFTMEARRLAELVKANVLASVQSDILDAAIPPQHRHPGGLWFGLSKWTRTVFYAKNRVDPDTVKTFADLTDPDWNGRICVRTSNKVYVQSLIAAMVINHGETATRKWVRGLVANFAREPVDLDIVQLKGVADGTCDLAIANSYYFARLKPMAYDVISGGPSSAQAILDEVDVLYLEQDSIGTHVNISGFGMTKSTENSATARRFMEFLARPAVQRLYADGSKDYPILPGLKPHLAMQSMGSFKEDALPLASLADYYELAETISRAEGWLWK